MTLVSKSINKTKNNTIYSIEFVESIIKKLNNDKFEYSGNSMEDCTYSNEEDGEILDVNWNGIVGYRNYKNDTEFEYFSEELAIRIRTAINHSNIRDKQRSLDEIESKYGFKFVEGMLLENSKGKIYKALRVEWNYVNGVKEPRIIGVSDPDRYWERDELPYNVKIKE